MKIIGVRDMELYLHGYQVFLIMGTALDFDMEKDGPTYPEKKNSKNM